MDTTSIANFRRDAGYAFAADDVAAKVHEATRGWAHLVDRVAFATGGADAFDTSFAGLDTTDLRERAGVDRDPALAAAWDDVVAVVADAPASACKVDALAAFVADEPTVAEALRREAVHSDLPDSNDAAALLAQSTSPTCSSPPLMVGFGPTPSSPGEPLGTPGTPPLAQLRRRGGHRSKMLPPGRAVTHHPRVAS